MPPKKALAPGAAALQPLDPNQEILSLREARSQKRKATSPTLQEEELDQEIRDMEIIHQQVQRKKEKMARLADLQRKIDEATEEVRHLAQDEQNRRPQHRELHQEGLFNEDGWYDDFNHDTFTFDDASPLATELQATPWPPSYKPPQLPMYDGHSDPKQFLMSYEATIYLYGGNTAGMVKSFVMAVRNVAQTWYYSLRPGTITLWQKLKDILVTSFQGFQTKPVTAQALFQCTQDHEEYLQAYVRRFLRLRSQAPTVPNEIVIEAMIKGLRGSNKALSGRQLQEVEAPGALEEDMGINPGRSIAYFVVKTRAILQECAKSPSKSRRRSQKPKLGRVIRSKSCTLLRATHPTYQNMWVIILQLLLFWLASHRLLGHSFHLRHHYNLSIHEVSSQKGANTPNSSGISGRNLKLAQSTVMCRSQSTSIERYPTF
jgi:hypothetical protein